MHVDLLQGHGQEEPSGGAWRPQERLILVLFFLFAVLVTPPRWWPLWGIEAAILGFVARQNGVPAAVLARRLLWFSLYVAILALGIPLSHGLQSGWVEMAIVFVRAVLSFACVLLLLLTTTVPEILAGLHGLRMPERFLGSLTLALRYAAVLNEERQRMVRARACRSYGTSPRRDWTNLPGLVGALFLRALERSERVHQALLARGWHGGLLADPAVRAPHQPLDGVPPTAAAPSPTGKPVTG